MSRTIKRGPPPRRPVTRGKRSVKKPSIGDRVLAMLPFSQDTLRKAATWSILGVAGASAIVAASWLGVPAMAGSAIAESAGRAGFRVEQIEITGLKRMDRMTVYAVATEEQPQGTPILGVDLGRIRERLLAYGWVADAHVSRRFPDVLLVDIVEREPAAVWQDNGQLTLIDKTGVLLEPVDAERMPDLPLVIGPGAHRQEAGYQQLMAAAPALKPRIRAASWIGNRRWDLTFDTGETLALPQDGAERALVDFARRDGANPLLGKGWMRFDMRDPAKFVLRKPGHDREQAVEDNEGDRGASAAPLRIETAQTDAG